MRAWVRPWQPGRPCSPRDSSPSSPSARQPPAVRLAGHVQERLSADIVEATAAASTMAHGLANVLYAQGRYDEAEQLTHECEEASRENDVHSQISWRSVRAKALARRGELDAAEELAREAVAIALTSDFLLGHGDALADLAEVLELRGERAAAAAVALQEAAALFDQKGHRLAAKRTRAQLMSL